MPAPKVISIDELFEEKGNQFSRFAEVCWGEDTTKTFLEVRRYVMNENNEETPLKGFTFLDREKGPGELAKAIVRNGFGDTQELLEELSERDNFSSSLNKVVGKDSPHYDDSILEEEFYDAKEFI